MSIFILASVVLPSVSLKSSSNFTMISDMAAGMIACLRFDTVG